jgi:hypothetical protein
MEPGEEASMETCGSCGGRLAPDIDWCPRCYTPRAVASAPTQLPSHLRMFPREELSPAPVYSRWRAGATTFGPLGRVVITVALVGFQAFWWKVVGAGGIEFVLVSYLASTVVSIWILTHVWKRDRVQ